MVGERKITKCCICGENFRGYGNSPSPIKNSGQCCDDCFLRVVNPARIEIFKKKELKKLKC